MKLSTEKIGKSKNCPGVFLLASVLVTLLLLTTAAWGWSPRLEDTSFLAAPAGGVLVDENKDYWVSEDETLMEIARRGGLGFANISAANPALDPWLLPPGQEVVLPYATILPLGIQPGITINLAEYRLYLLWQESGQWRVRIYPIGFGREGWETPEGTFKVISNVANPTWVMPESIRGEHPGENPVVPPGPDNPLGTRWIGLSIDGYGIHGTNRPYGIGRRVSHGCIRLYPNDIENLASLVRPGTPINIIYQPIKLGLQDGQLYAEVHDDFLQRYNVETMGRAMEVARQANLLQWQQGFDLVKLQKALDEIRGVPVPVGNGS